MKHGAEKAYTLVEVLIVVVVLGILAMVVVPRFSDASEQAKEAALLTDLQTLQRQIDLYRTEHSGRGPHLNATGTLDSGNFKTRLLTKTDPDGTLNPNGSCGPYVVEWPPNPFDEAPTSVDVQLHKWTTSRRNGTTGWYYCILNGKIYPNSASGALDEFPPAD